MKKSLLLLIERNFQYFLWEEILDISNAKKSLIFSIEKRSRRTCCQHEKFKADLLADVSSSNALEGVHSSGKVHKCSHREGKETVSAVRFHAFSPNAVSVHFSC